MSNDYDGVRRAVIDPRWAKVAIGDAELVVDIETVIDSECPPRPKADGSVDEFPAPPHWRVVVIGLGWVVGGHLMKLGTLVAQDADDEARVLRRFVKIFDGETAPKRVVGWNTRGFDLPVIAHRCMRHGIPWRWYYRDTRGANPRYRFSEDAHLDLMDWLSDHGASRRAALDSACRLIGLPGKLDVAGGDVAGLMRSVDDGLQRVADYCLEDVAQTAAVAQRFELVRGRIDVAAYRARMASWRDVVAASSARAVVGGDLTRVLMLGDEEVSL